jgi:hypothetical protein
MYGGRVQIFRDEKVSTFKASVFDQLASIAQKFEPQISKVENTTQLPLISVEQAIKELLEMQNEIDQKKILNFLKAYTFLKIKKNIKDTIILDI